MANLAQHMSKTNEWYTPGWIIDLVNKTFVNGYIDLDPASSVVANNTVRAKTYYTIEDDGLSRDWYGSVFCNPPYGRFVSMWVDKMISEYNQKKITEGILLVHSNTETKWFQRLFEHHICFVSPRICFIDQDGNEQKSPPNANAIVYIGPNSKRFLNSFRGHGHICSPSQTP
jgi:phage N-6-adenine-methyltransferase